jgi:hypothetical protein
MTTVMQIDHIFDDIVSESRVPDGEGDDVNLQFKCDSLAFLRRR